MYNPEYSQTKAKNPKYSLRGGTLGKRGEDDLRNNPGPGTYTVEKNAGFENKGHVFGSEKQRIDAKSSSKASPAPGNSLLLIV